MSVPRNEYPRPDMVRRDDTWINLNGKWEFEFDFGDSGKDRGFWESEHFSREIIVPFVPESKLSGSTPILLSPVGTREALIFLPNGTQRAGVFLYTSELSIISAM